MIHMIKYQFYYLFNLSFSLNKDKKEILNLNYSFSLFSVLLLKIRFLIFNKN
jgi:hypothetical protein